MQKTRQLEIQSRRSNICKTEVPEREFKKINKGIYTNNKTELMT